MQTLSKSYELCKFSCVGSIRGIPSGRGWAHHARSGSQSEHRIHFILPACAASYMIKCLTEQDIYWPIMCYPRSQVPTCCLFSTQESNWTIELQNSTRWSVDGLMNLHCFPQPLMTGSSVPEPKYWENIYFTVDLMFIFHLLLSSLLPTVRGENE